MRIRKIVLIATLLFFVDFAVSYGADVAKIGVVDLQKILELSDAGKKAQAEINKQGKKMETDLKKKGTEIDQIKKQLEREAMVMSRDMREDKNRELRIKSNDIKILQKKYMTDFKVFESKLVGRIQKEVFKIVEETGKKEGYLLVVERQEGGVLYYPNSIDITDKLIQQYNAEYAKKKDNWGADIKIKH